MNVLVPGNNPRRAAEFALTKANMAKVGFELVGEVRTDWGSLLGTSKYDAFFFAWSSSSVTQRQSCGLFETNGANNYVTGFSNASFDGLCNALAIPMSSSLLTAKYIAAERITNAAAITVGVFVHPGVYAVNKDLKGIKPSPLSPNITWNYWEWSY